MKYNVLVDKIKSMAQNNNNSSEICKNLNITRHKFYNICNREGIIYNKITGGRTIGATDKQKRTRRRNPHKTGGNVEFNTDEISKEVDDYAKHLNNNTDLSDFCDVILKDAKKEITQTDVLNYDITMSV